MKRIFLAITLGYCIAQAQVQTVSWSKATSNDTAKMASSNWGILSKFLTFNDGTKFTSANLTQSQVVGLTDSLTDKLNRGEATTLFAAKINYSDTTNTLANQWRLGGYYARGDTGSVLASKLFVLNQYYARGDTGDVLLGKTRASEIYQPILFLRNATAGQGGTLSTTNAADTILIRDAYYVQYTDTTTEGVIKGLTVKSPQNNYTVFGGSTTRSTDNTYNEDFMHFGFNPFTNGTVGGKVLRYFWKLEGNYSVTNKAEFYLNIGANPFNGGVYRHDFETIDLTTGKRSKAISHGLGYNSANPSGLFLNEAGTSQVFQIGGVPWVQADSVNGSTWTTMKGALWILGSGAQFLDDAGTWRLRDNQSGWHSKEFQFGAAGAPSAGSQVIINSTVANALLFKTTGSGTQGSIDSSANASLRSLILTTALDTAYSNSVSNVSTYTPLSVATSGKTKFISVDTSNTTTGLTTLYQNSLKADKSTTLTAGYGINTIGDLSTNRTVSSDTANAQATTSRTGYLLYTDWNTFNNKQATVSATLPIVISGNVISSHKASATDSGYVIASDFSNFSTAFSERRQWDGGSTNLVAATGRTSLGLGSMALTDSTTYHGSASINTLGTITTGGYQGTSIDTAYTDAVSNIAVTSLLTVATSGKTRFLSADTTTYLASKSFLTNQYAPKLGSSDIVTVGALTSGSIASGFGSINIGSNTISSGAVTATGLSSFSENGGTATAGVGDSVQVTVTGVAPSTCQAVASYAEVTTAITIPPGAVCWSANTLTVYGANGKKLKYSISVK